MVTLMIEPTWQDHDQNRRIVYVYSDRVGLVEEDQSNLCEIACDEDHGTLVSWNEHDVTIELDGRSGHKTCARRCLFWEDNKGDFDERRSLEHD